MRKSARKARKKSVKNDLKIIQNKRSEEKTGKKKFRFEEIRECPRDDRPAARRRIIISEKKFSAKRKTQNERRKLKI